MRTGLIVAIILAITGCAGSSPRIDASRLDELRKGQTTVSQVVAEFGRPTVLSRNMDGSQTAAYVFNNGRSAGGSLVPLVGALAGNADANVDSVIFSFDTRGVLTNYKTTQASAAGKTAPAEASQAAQASPAGPARTSTSPSTQSGAAKPPEPPTNSGPKLNLPSLLPSATKDPRATD